MTARIENIVRSQFEGFSPFIANLSMGNNDTQDIIAAVPGKKIRAIQYLISWDKSPDYFYLLSGATPKTGNIYTPNGPGWLNQATASGMLVTETAIGEAFRIFTRKGCEIGITGIYTLVP